MYFADLEHSVRRMPTGGFGDVDHMSRSAATLVGCIIDQVWPAAKFARFFLIESPVISMRYAPCTSLSRMASAMVGAAIPANQSVTGI